MVDQKIGEVYRKAGWDNRNTNEVDRRGDEVNKNDGRVNLRMCGLNFCQDGKKSCHRCCC